jgi:hypothetical protein
MKVHTLGIDLAKNVFQLHGVDRKGRPVLVRRVRREQLLKVLGELESCLIGIEASTGAFYWQRQFEKLGHVVKIMAPQYVKPFVRRQKNDSNDAEAICTAVQQRNMRFVPKKTLEQQDIPGAPPRAAAAGQSSHRIDQPDARTPARPRYSDCGLCHPGAAAHPENLVGNQR